MKTGETLLKARQVAARLNVSIGWVNAHASGRYHPVLPSFKMGRTRRFRNEDIDGFIEHCNQAMAAGRPIQ